VQVYRAPRVYFGLMPPPFQRAIVSVAKELAPTGQVHSGNTDLNIQWCGPDNWKGPCIPVCVIHIAMH